MEYRPFHFTLNIQRHLCRYIIIEGIDLPGKHVRKSISDKRLLYLIIRGNPCIFNLEPKLLLFLFG